MLACPTWIGGKDWESGHDSARISVDPAFIGYSGDLKRPDDGWWNLKWLAIGLAVAEAVLGCTRAPGCAIIAPDDWSTTEGGEVAKSRSRAMAMAITVTLMAATTLAAGRPSQGGGSYQRVCDICFAVNISHGRGNLETVGDRGACRGDERAAKRDARLHWSNEHQKRTLAQFRGRPSRVTVHHFSDAKCQEHGEPIWSVDEALDSSESVNQARN